MCEMTADFEGQKLSDLVPRQFEHAAMSKMSAVIAERGRQNRAYVHELLWQRQPGFAAALASAEHCLSSRILSSCSRSHAAGATHRCATRHLGTATLLVSGQASIPGVAVAILKDQGRSATL
jgi:hypothetical protein